MWQHFISLFSLFLLFVSIFIFLICTHCHCHCPDHFSVSPLLLWKLNYIFLLRLNFYFPNIVHFVNPSILRTKFYLLNIVHFSIILFCVQSFTYKILSIFLSSSSAYEVLLTKYCPFFYHPILRMKFKLQNIVHYLILIFCVWIFTY